MAARIVPQSRAAQEIHAARTLLYAEMHGTHQGTSQVAATRQAFMDFAALGAATNGTYDSATLQSFVDAINRGAIPDANAYSDVTTQAPGNNWYTIQRYFGASHATFGTIGADLGSGFQPHLSNPNVRTDIPKALQRHPSRNPAAAKTDPGFTDPGIGPTNLGIGSALTAIANVFGDLTNPKFWIRAGEVVVGGAVFLIAIDKAFNVPVSPTSIAKKVL